MKSFTIVALLYLAPLPILQAEDDPFTQSTPEARPQRTIAKLPKSITYKKIHAKQHEYTVSGIYNASENNEQLKDVASIYKACIPDSVAMSLDFKAMKATFSTSRELSLSELAYALDDMAELGGDLPYLVEMESRDILPSDLAARLQYNTSPIESEAPSSLAWLGGPGDQPLRIPISFGGPGLGTLLIVPSTAHCMADSRYVVRILDGEGLLIWADEKTFFAQITIATSDVDNDSIHEIWINRDDHGHKARFQIKGAFKK